MAVVVVIVVAGIQLSDPIQPKDPSTTAVDTDAPAADIAMTAIRHTRPSDYQFVHNRTYESDSYSWTNRTLTVENSDREFLLKETLSGGRARAYGNDAAGYVQRHPRADWRLRADRRYIPGRNVLAPPTILADANVTVQAVTDTTVVVVVRDTAVANALLAPGFLNPAAETAMVRLTIRRADGRIVTIHRVAAVTSPAINWTDIGTLRGIGDSAGGSWSAPCGTDLGRASRATVSRMMRLIGRLGLWLGGSLLAGITMAVYFGSLTLTTEPTPSAVLEAIGFPTVMAALVLGAALVVSVLSSEQ